MTRKPSRIAVVGACHVDRKARAAAAYVEGASNPVTVESCPGGVARNVAQNLCLLGCAVELVTRLGRDAEGDQVLAGLQGLPLGLAGVTRSDGTPTAFHLIALQPDGEMLVAVADMRVYEEITPSLLRALPEEIWAVDAVFADCNLPGQSLAFLAGLRHEGRRFAVNGVSPAKVVRIKDHLAACDLLCLNLGEAAALLDRPAAALDPASAAAALVARGAGEVAMTLGPEGACFAAGAEVVALPGLAGPVADVTGAGDALAAAFLEARLGGLELEPAGRRALAAARLTVEASESVSPLLSPRKLEEMIA